MINNIDNLREIVRSFQSDKRFSHTVGVENEAFKLGTIFIPDKADKLRLTGLLHDITKDFKTEKHLELCEIYGINVDKRNLVPKLLHSKTGCEFAKRQFGSEIVDEEVYNGILYHTTGREGMTLFEALIYLADYIEETRTFDDCVILRKYFYSEIEKTSSYSERLEILRKTMIFSFDLTVKSLIDEGKSIDFDTIKARNYFISNDKVFK